MSRPQVHPSKYRQCSTQTALFPRIDIHTPKQQQNIHFETLEEEGNEAPSDNFYLEELIQREAQCEELNTAELLHRNISREKKKQKKRNGGQGKQKQKSGNFGTEMDELSGWGESTDLIKKNKTYLNKQQEQAQQKAVSPPFRQSGLSFYQSQNTSMQKFFKPEYSRPKKNSSKLSSFIGRQETMDTLDQEFRIVPINSRQVSFGRKEQKKYLEIEKLFNKILVGPPKGKVLKSQLGLDYKKTFLDHLIDNKQPSSPKFFQVKSYEPPESSLGIVKENDERCKLPSPTGSSALKSFSTANQASDHYSRQRNGGNAFKKTHKSLQEDKFPLVIKPQRVIHGMNYSQLKKMEEREQKNSKHKKVLLSMVQQQKANMKTKFLSRGNSQNDVTQKSNENGNILQQPNFTMEGEKKIPALQIYQRSSNNTTFHGKDQLRLIKNGQQQITDLILMKYDQKDREKMLQKCLNVYRSNGN